MDVVDVLLDLKHKIQDIADRHAEGMGDGKLSSRDAAKLRSLLARAKGIVDEEYTGGRCGGYWSRYLGFTLEHSGPAVGALRNHAEESLEYLEGAIEEIGGRRTRLRDEDFVPAADRYVAISDNQRQDLKGSLSELSEAIRGDNLIDPESKEAVLYEIAIFEATLVAPRLSLAMIEKFTNETLQWIVKTMINASASEIAKRVMLMLTGM